MMHFDIVAPAGGIDTRLQELIDNKTKPRGALGRLEAVALQAGRIQQSTRPELRNPHILVFAGDHGIAATATVNPYPQSVTAQMVSNFARGGAAINVFCRQHGIILQVVDAGVNAVFPPGLGIADEKMAMGTRNYLDTPAMTEEECATAVSRGAAMVKKIAGSGCNVIGFGEMGIGNSSAAALLMSCIMGLPVRDCAGTGTGAEGDFLQKKIAVLEKAQERYCSGRSLSAIEALYTFGGFEMAMMTGAMLQAAAEKMIVLVDGFIAGAALLVAAAVNPLVKEYCVYCHLSGEQGHRKMLEYFGATPLLQLDMRLGEGTGCAVAFPLLQSALAFLNEMASFEDAGITGKPAV